ncbi:hypothetical protein D3C83_26870 [compost metagenome]
MKGSEMRVAFRSVSFFSAQASLYGVVGVKRSVVNDRSFGDPGDGGVVVGAKKRS